MATQKTFLEALDELNAALSAAARAHQLVMDARAGYVYDDTENPDGWRRATEQDVAAALALRAAADKTALAKRVALTHVQRRQEAARRSAV